MENNEGTLKKSIRGGKWVFLNTIVQKIISLGSFFVLARLLVPEDFGIVTLLFIAPNFLDLLTTFGFEIALIQSKENPEPYLNSAWSFGILRSLAIFILVFFSAPLIANFFHIGKAIWAIRLSGICIVIATLGNIAQLFFFKEIDFKKLFIRDITATLGYSIVAIGFAIFYKSFWPLFFGYIAQYLSGSAITYALHKFRPRLSFKFSKLKELVGYSKWIFGQNLIINTIPLIENGLVGKFVNATGVGLYSRAKSLAVIPSAPLYNVIDILTFPAYSKIQDNYEKIKEGFLKSLDLLFFLTVPFILLFLTLGYRIIFIFLGEKWIGINVLLKILLFAVTINILNAISGPIFNAIGKPKIQFYINMMNIITVVFLILLLTPLYGTIGTATGVLINSLIIFLFSFYKLVEILKIKIISIIKPLFIALVSSSLALLIGKIILIVTKSNNAVFIITLIITGIIYCIFISLAGKLLKEGPYATIRFIILEILQRKKKDVI